MSDEFPAETEGRLRIVRAVRKLADDLFDPLVLGPSDPPRPPEETEPR
jgi:hypothetical protein